MFFCHMERDQDETKYQLKNAIEIFFRIARAFQDKIYCICVVYDLTNLKCYLVQKYNKKIQNLNIGLFIYSVWCKN